MQPSALLTEGRCGKKKTLFNALLYLDERGLYEQSQPYLTPQFSKSQPLKGLIWTCDLLAVFMFYFTFIWPLLKLYWDEQLSLQAKTVAYERLRIKQ